LTPDPPDAKDDSAIDDSNLTAKEHFVFTDPLGQVNIFRISEHFTNLHFGQQV
jgi:hypothetical protein